MEIETEEAQLTVSASKFEALLHQFIKLYDRLTLEHSLMTERELKLLKNLEGFKEIVLQLNSAITKMNITMSDLKTMDLKLSTVIKNNIIEATDKTKNDLLDVNENTLERSLGRCIEQCSNKLHYAANQIHELLDERGKGDHRLAFLLLIGCALISLIIGLFMGASFFK